VDSLQVAFLRQKPCSDYGITRNRLSLGAIKLVTGAYQGCEFFCIRLVQCKFIQAFQIASSAAAIFRAMRGLSISIIA
jgi:hypothetical protein